MTTHTPGNWKVHTEGEKTGILTENNVEHLATCYGFRKEGNARLMAAAPELLEALKDAEFLLRKAGLMAGPMRDSFNRSASDAREAIAKAEGNA
jgi:hypothetical protein